MGDGGVAATSNISIFLRVRPVARPSPRLMLLPADATAEFNIPRDAVAGPVNNTRERYLFQFDGVILPDAKQDEVFERTARPLVGAALDGFNATLFAYGQTGSGKTFTITGGAERYVDRGIIPRALSALYAGIAQRGDLEIQVYISYLEIYNEVGYDLLDPAREVAQLEDMPQVYIQEDEEGRINLRNLSSHMAATEEEALNLLFLGDTNRTISETPMNQASSRSHCVFSVALEARRPGSDTVRRSKLNLVDLAGSERVGKTGSEGVVLKEAKYINLSLHYLEQVIVALQERSIGISRAHVPYRNSLMTMVLRDSLGGNCRTVMVATINAEQEQLDESISTCRFAQRVAMVTNELRVNEEVDPAAIIRRLKQEIRDLKDELRLLRGAPERGPLTPDELARLEAQVRAFCEDGGEGAALAQGGGLMAIRACFDIFRSMVRNQGGGPAALSGAQASFPAAPVGLQASTRQPRLAPAQQSSGAGGSSTYTGGGGGTGGPGGSRAAAPGQPDEAPVLRQQVRKLRLQVQQRDIEIATLLGMLRQQRGQQHRNPLAPQLDAGGALGDREAAAAAEQDSEGASDQAPPDQQPTLLKQQAEQQQAQSAWRQVGGGKRGDMEVLSALLDVNLLADRNKSFEVFKQSYRHNEAIEENKQQLKAKYDESKGLGAGINAAKGRIGQLRTALEQRRMQRSAACVASGKDPAVELSEDDPEEQRCRRQIDQEKATYTASFERLRQLKGEIQHLQMLLEGSRQRLQQDFQQWVELMVRQQQEKQEKQEQQEQQKDGRGQQQHRAKEQQHTTQPSRLGVAQQPLQVPPSPPRQQQRQEQQEGQQQQEQQQQQQQQREQCEQQPGRSGRQDPIPLSSVDPAVLEAAKPHLTGNPAADDDIIRFYEAREKLLQKLGTTL